MYMFDFLAKATIADVAETQTARKGGPRKDRNPEGMAIRVFFDGSVYPSTELVGKFNLEYVPGVIVGTNESAEGEKVAFKPAEEPGFGFDVVDTKHFPAFELPVGYRVLLISPVNRKAGRVDLFASTTYEKDGMPKSSVLEQGAKTYGSEELIPMLEEVYGVTFKKRIEYKEGEKKEGDPAYTDGADSVDLIFVSNPATNEPWNKDFCWIPKRVSRGKAQGEFTTARREKVQFYALMPKEMVEASTSPAPAPQGTVVEAVAE
jgi:hypothetical protein